MTKKIQKMGIIGSMDAEIDQYLKHSTSVKERHWNDFIFREARLFGKKAIIVKSGVGKVFSAMVCERLIDEYDPTTIVFTGVAGALNERLEIGDVVISKDCIQHDIDVQSLGFSRGTIPFTEYRIFTADDRLRKLALMAKLRGNKIIEGRILTGDQFMTKKDTAEHKYLKEELKGDAIEMEGGSIAMVCTLNRVPFLVVRTIADKADGIAVEDFNRFMPVVAKNSYKIVSSIVQNL